MKGTTRKLAEFAAELSFEALPGDVWEHLKLCVLDWLGAALAGAGEPTARIVAGLAGRGGGTSEATVVGAGRTDCTGAAWANGVIGHLVELDDIHAKSIIHPGATAVPAALACAERERAPGSEFLAAVAAGYEVGIRIGMAVNPSHYRFWHTTGTCGTFGAAAAAGRLLGLDAERMTHALGIAGTHAAGLLEVFGTGSKPLNPGRAARDGVLAALLAREGLTGPAEILEAEKGFFAATSAEFDASRATARLGESFELTRNVFKRHASCGHTHAPVDAVLELAAERGLTADDVAEIDVGTYPIAVEAVGGAYGPKTADEARFSLPYCVAAALLRGKLGLEEFSPECLADPGIAGLAERVKVSADPEFAERRLGAARVTVRTTGGEEISSKVESPRGYPDNPLSRAEIEEKFAALAAGTVPAGRAAEISALVGELDKLESIEALTGLLAAGPKGG